MSSNLGKLWIIATPLGNPGDLSPRAREVLSRVHRIAAEDTRRTGRLLADCGIEHQGFFSLHEHNEQDRAPQVLSLLREGHDVALVSDAGTPLLSDPGFLLVRACRQAGVTVSPVPGPSAPAAALSACGIAPLPYVFLGFAPRKAGEREAFFAPYRDLALTLVFFERKDRLKETLAVAAGILGQRTACVARELTKPFEEFLVFPLSEHSTLSDNLLGEMTVIIGPPEGDRRDTPERVRVVIAEEAALGGKPKVVAGRVQARVNGWTGKEIYALMLQEETP